MLVLSRKAGERLVIGEHVEITVTQIGKGRVRLGIAAPNDVHIRRGELPVRSTAVKQTAEPMPHLPPLCLSCRNDQPMGDRSV